MFKKYYTLYKALKAEAKAEGKNNDQTRNACEA